jgi:ATP-dependent DNA ligase
MLKERKVRSRANFRVQVDSFPLQHPFPLSHIKWFIPMKKLPKISPLKLTRLRAPFDNPDWVSELKHDGFRALAYITEDGCRLVSRRDNTFKSFNPLREALRNLPVKNAILDGEIVCLDAQGNSLFNELLFRRGRLTICNANESGETQSKSVGGQYVFWAGSLERASLSESG